MQKIMKERFQFQNGTIKSLKLTKVHPFKIDFNSKMVRLKEFASPIKLDGSEGFQFQNGTIKRDKGVIDISKFM